MNQTKIAWPGWETVKLIGRGSFGAVYEIQRDVLGETEKAALKVISIPQNSSDIDEMYADGYDEESLTSTFQGYLKSITDEYNLMRKMRGCTNIVSCDDLQYTQHEDGIGWDILIRMELLTPLTKTLPETVPESLVIKLARDMCGALKLCKENNVVHRDIKPQNIFVSPYGDYKLGDFGIAKTVEKTMGGTKIGTYKYMAPEVYNNQPYGHGADIYSLGLVLYWLLNEKRMPFLPLPPEKLSGPLEEKARQRRMEGEPLPPPAHGSEKLKRIVLKACAYDPKDRYATAQELLRDLEGPAKKDPPKKEPPQREPQKDQEPPRKEPPKKDPPREKPASLDLRTSVLISGPQAVQGVTRSVHFGKYKTLEVKIPAGVADGQELRLKGAGLEDPETGARGDAYVKINVSEPVYRNGGSQGGAQKSGDVNWVIITGENARNGCFFQRKELSTGKLYNFHIRPGVENGGVYTLNGYGAKNDIIQREFRVLIRNAQMTETPACPWKEMPESVLQQYSNAYRSPGKRTLGIIIGVVMFLLCACVIVATIKDSPGIGMVVSIVLACLGFALLKSNLRPKASERINGLAAREELLRRQNSGI